jgi:sulfatase maturation enzyme AslB (radical SAM superfamily)
VTTGLSAPIAITALRELWIHTGTACNLSCPFCHEGSKPGDTRLQAPSPAELAPLLSAAAARGVVRFAFTGGEPLILRGIREILLHALSLRPVLVLTNGTAPFIRRSHQLAELARAPHALGFRVSIDYPDEARHDAGRGLQNFRKALEGMRLLHAAGFAVGITRQSTAQEDTAAVDAEFRRLLRRQRLPQDLSIVALPELGPPNLAGTRSVPFAALAIPPVPPACTFSRMVVRRRGELRLHACPLTDDAQRFDVGASLEAAMAARVDPDHPRCGQCLTRGVDYAGACAQ